MRSEATPGFGGAPPASFHLASSKAAAASECGEALDPLATIPWQYQASETIQARFSVPYVVSVCMACVFAAPTIVAIRLGTDADAAFWIGRVGLLAWLIPVFLATMHMIHLLQLSRGAPRRSTVDLSGIVPAVILAVIGIFYSMEAAFLESHLRSDDCNARSSQPLMEKPRLEAAYVLALKAYAACQEEHFARNGHEMLPASPRPTLQQCWQWKTMDESLDLGEELVYWKGYVDDQTVAEWFLGSLGFSWITRNYWADRPMQAHEYYWREWHYLAHLEANHFCGGFCEPGPSLFNDYDMSGRQGGKCAPLVGLKFGVIHYEGQLVLWTSVISLVLMLAVLKPLVTPYLKELGYAGLDD